MPLSFYNNIFSATHKYYSKFKTEAPLFSSVCVVTVSQIMLLFLIIVLLKVFGVIDLFRFIPNKFYFVPVFVLWLFLNLQYYSKDKVLELLQNFEVKTPREKRKWAIVSIMCMILPIIIIAVALSK